VPTPGLLFCYFGLCKNSFATTPRSGSRVCYFVILLFCYFGRSVEPQILCSTQPRSRRFKVLLFCYFGRASTPKICTPHSLAPGCSSLCYFVILLFCYFVILLFCSLAATAVAQLLCQARAAGGSCGSYVGAVGVTWELWELRGSCGSYLGAVRVTWELCELRGSCASYVGAHSYMISQREVFIASTLLRMYCTYRKDARTHPPNQASPLLLLQLRVPCLLLPPSFLLAPTMEGAGPSNLDADVAQAEVLHALRSHIRAANVTTEVGDLNLSFRSKRGGRRVRDSMKNKALTLTVKSSDEHKTKHT
jgi:hypothetical protein